MNDSELFFLLIGIYLGTVIGACVSMVICSVTNWGKEKADEFTRKLFSRTKDNKTY